MYLAIAIMILFGAGLLVLSFWLSDADIKILRKILGAKRKKEERNNNISRIKDAFKHE